MKKLLTLIAVVLLGVSQAEASSLTIGAPGDPFTGDCAPFGCVLEYQQVYDAGLFPGAVTITALTFFNLNFVPGDIAAANYEFALSTTSAAVNGLSATFSDNLGADNVVFFTGLLGGPIGPTNQFTVTGTPFLFDPSLGNLLLTIKKDGGEFDFSVFADVLTNAPAGTFSRAYSFDNSGLASALEPDTGLVTEFSFTDTDVVPVPEPTTLLLLTSGLLSVRRRSRCIHQDSFMRDLRSDIKSGA